MQRPTMTLMICALLLTAGGCADEETPLEDVVARSGCDGLHGEFRDGNWNGWDPNGWDPNGWDPNGWDPNGWDPNGYDPNGWGQNGAPSGHVAVAMRPLNGVLGGSAIAELAASPDTCQTAEYLVSCALPDGETAFVDLDGVVVAFEGSTGVAPRWADQSCDAHCQSWVSACMLARANAKGEHVLISMRGDHEALALEPGEAQSHTQPEATYYGNLFAEDPRLHGCVLPGSDGLVRTCGGDGDCVIANEGPCEHACDETGCTDVDGNHYAETISVYLDPTAPTGSIPATSAQTLSGSPL